MLKLFPGISDYYSLYKYQDIDETYSYEAFMKLREIALENPIGEIGWKCREIIAAMEIVGLGCNSIHKDLRKYELSNFFTTRTSCPKFIYNKGLKRWQSLGIYDMSKFISGETTESWKYAKHNPYMNSSGGSYLHYIFCPFRPMTVVNKPFVFRKKNKFGFKNQTGEVILSPMFNMAFPFDETEGVAMVQNENNKWGAITEIGEIAIPFDYDVVNDVFIQGKNFAIKENSLILIDSSGNELRRISGYNYLIPKLADNQIIAYNYITKQYDAYDFNGNCVHTDCFPRELIHQTRNELMNGKDPKHLWPNDKRKYLSYFISTFNEIHYVYQDDMNREYIKFIWDTIAR